MLHGAKQPLANRHSTRSQQDAQGIKGKLLHLLGPVDQDKSWRICTVDDRPQQPSLFRDLHRSAGSSSRNSFSQRRANTILEPILWCHIRNPVRDCHGVALLPNGCRPRPGAHRNPCRCPTRQPTDRPPLVSIHSRILLLDFFKFGEKPPTQKRG